MRGVLVDAKERDELAFAVADAVEARMAAFDPAGLLIDVERAREQVNQIDDVLRRIAKAIIGTYERGGGSVEHG